MTVPFHDLTRQHAELEAEIARAARRVMLSGAYILGEEVAAFEREFASFCGAQDAVGVGNGTDALTLALIASGAVRPGRGDEVITSTLTAAYTALAILNAGGVPVFADIDPRTYTLDPESVETFITPRTRAVVPVHLYGQMADMPAICEIARQRDLFVIEDAAQAHGASLESTPPGWCSNAATYSFYPTKNLGAFGDGGAVVSNDPSLIERVKTLRQGGHPLALSGQMEGRCSRLDELHAAILLVKLKLLHEWNLRRREYAALYTEMLGRRGDTRVKVPFVTVPDAHVFHLYVIQHPSRDELRVHLSERGIEALIHYPYLLHEQPLFQRDKQRSLPVAERIVKTILSLPLYPQLKREEAHAVARAILDFETRR